MSESKKNLFLTDAQLRAEIARCEFCEEKPCKGKCPVGCSPADFIMAVRKFQPSDFRRAAGIIMRSNPLGGVCGATCPDTHCMSACSRAGLDTPINIPAVQATIIQKAKELGVMPTFKPLVASGRKVAVVGAGPAGIGAAVYLAQQGHKVVVHDALKRRGGAAALIPEYRLDPTVLESDLDFWTNPLIEYKPSSRIDDPKTLLGANDAVVVAVGLHKPVKPGIPGEEVALYANEYLAARPALAGTVAIYGGGAIAVDCAVTAKHAGAASVRMYFLENNSEMPLTGAERKELLEAGVELHPRTRITKVNLKDGKVAGLETERVSLKAGQKFSLANLDTVAGSAALVPDVTALVIAIGNRSALPRDEAYGLFVAGDMQTGPSTVVEAVASGKNTASRVHAFLTNAAAPKIEVANRSTVEVKGWCPVPVSLATDFFGRPIKSPFLLSAAPPSDGFEQMKKAYEAGWAGGIMKTSFARGPIHIPERYMHQFDDLTYGNCDNVSGHLLGRVTAEIRELVRLYPDRLTIGSTGGPVTGNDEHDRAGWQANTKTLEEAGAMGIEYSLSCPQGGDGTEGDIVSQNARLTQKIIGWIMEVSDPNVPKLFKLTGAVTSIAAIVIAIREVLAKYPGKKAGITLANTFPTMDFRAGAKKEWDEAIVYGMSGQGVLPISYLSLASVHSLGVAISGNGGPMDYKAAANFLALGCKTVQFCTIAMKHGYGIINDLEMGLSHLMQERGIKSVNELIGIANKPSPITGFMELSAEKKISAVNADLCLHCGNCTRCPYLAISLDGNKVPVTDASKCIGCSICAQKCFSGALYMRDRTAAEKAVLSEE